MIKSYIISLIIAICSISCSSVIEVPKEVDIPVKCKIDKTPSPINKAQDENDYAGIKLNNDNILIYTEVLEKDIKFCREGDKK